MLIGLAAGATPLIAGLALMAVTYDGWAISLFAYAMAFGFATGAVVLSLERQLVVSEHRQCEMALQDPLTGLPNRRAFDAALEREVSGAPLRGREVDDQTALVFIDINHFKAINDLFGHPTGDTVLRAIAGVATKTLRPGDLLARIGGDEFAIVASRTGEAGARRIVARIEEAFKSVTPGPGVEPVSAAIAYALLGVDGDDAASLMHVADHRLHRGKSDRLDDALSALLGY